MNSKTLNKFLYGLYKTYGLNCVKRCYCSETYLNFLRSISNKNVNFWSMFAILNMDWNVDVIESVKRKSSFWFNMSFVPRIFNKPFEGYENYFDWDVISKCGYLNDSIIDKYQDKINWHLLSANEHFHFTESFMLKHKDKIDFKNLIYSANVDWTLDVIKKHVPQHLWMQLLRKGHNLTAEIICELDNYNYECNKKRGTHKKRR